MIASTASAEETCANIYQTAHVNPLELSEKQKCFIDMDYKDEISGSYAGFIWFRVGEELVSVDANSFRINTKEQIYALLDVKIREEQTRQTQEIADNQEIELKNKLEVIRSEILQITAISTIAPISDKDKLHLLDLLDQEAAITNILYK